MKRSDIRNLTYALRDAARVLKRLEDVDRHIGGGGCVSPIGPLTQCIRDARNLYVAISEMINMEGE